MADDNKAVTSTDEVKEILSNSEKTEEKAVEIEVEDSKNKSEDVDVIDNNNTTKSDSETSELEKNIPEETAFEKSEEKVVGFGQKIVQIIKNPKKTGILGAIIAVILIVFFVMNGPKSVINDIKLTFSGYDERGTATYNEVEVKAKIAQIIAEKNGVKVPEIQNANSSLNALNDFMKNVFSGNADYYKKLSAIAGQYEAVVITLDKSSNLKNGDIITVTVQTGPNSPIKAETKTFTVSDLKPITKVDMQTVLTENVVSSTGYNGYGSLKYDTDIYKIKESGLTNLKNGQKITVQIKDSYIDNLLKNGKVFEGNKTTTIEIKGLKDLKTIKNITDVYAQVADLAKAKYANTNGSSYTYSIEKKNDFMKYEPSSRKNTVTMVSVYKINEKYSGYGGDTVKDYYVIIGYSNLELFENSVILSDLQYKTYSHSSEYKDENSANAYLKSKGFVEYKR